MKISISGATGLLLISTVFLLGGCQAFYKLDAVQLNEKGKIYFKYGEYQQAAEHFNASIDINFEDSAAHYWLGRCQEIMGQNVKAVESYRLAVRFAPAMEIAQTALITALHRNGQIDQSIQAAKTFLQHTSGPASNIMRLAEVFQTEGMDRQVVLVYLRAQKVEPNNPQPSLALARYYFKQGNEPEGVGALTAAFMINPYYPGLARELGEHGQRVEIPEPPMFPRPSAMQRELSEN